MSARKAAPPQPSPDEAIPIATLLREAGFDTPAAARAARDALERAKLTRLGKQGIAAYKRQSALDVLEAQFVLVCGEACRVLAPAGKTPAVTQRRCEVCGGSNNRRAMLAAARALQANGITSVLIIGGKEEQHREVAGVFGQHGVSVQGVVGTRVSHNQKEAQANMRRAGLMVIWGATELRHALSELYTASPPPGLRKVPVARRSIEALCDAIVRTFTPRRRP
jgi:hypothetical protein